MTRVGVIEWWTSMGPRFQSLLRIVAAAMFMTFGSMNLFSFPVPKSPSGAGLKLVSEMGLGASLEVFGGVLLLIGLFTRPVAFVLSGMMAVAYFQFHAPQGFWPLLNGGSLSVLYCFVWLYFSSAGGGPWSLDTWRQKQ